jgi:hypothetical protein
VRYVCKKSKNVKFAASYTMKAYKGSSGVAPVIPKLCSRCRFGQFHALATHPQVKVLPVLLNRRLDEPPVSLYVTEKRGMLLLCFTAVVRMQLSLVADIDFN